MNKELSDEELDNVAGGDAIIWNNEDIEAFHQILIRLVIALNGKCVVCNNDIDIDLSASPEEKKQNC